MADTIRNVEDLNLDDIDEELLTDQAIAMGKALGVDTREGSVYMDAAAGHISRTAEFLSYLAEIRDVTSIFTATGEVLDEYLSSRGLTRVPAEATSAVYLCKYTGSAPTVGATVIVDEYEFTVTSVNETASTALITSTDTGTDMNSFVSGTAVIPEDDIDGMDSFTISYLSTAAKDIEEDDSARERLLTSIGTEVESGNAEQYKKWCLSITGVGRASIYPKYEGPGTVAAFLTSSTGEMPSSSVVKKVQDYIDPNKNGDGSGVGPVGATFKAYAAEQLVLPISFNLSCSTSSDTQAIVNTAVSVINEYFRDLALKGSISNDTHTGTIYYNTILYKIMGIDGVLDCTDLKVNSGTANITYTDKQVPVRGKMDISCTKTLSDGTQETYSYSEESAEITTAS